MPNQTYKDLFAKNQERFNALKAKTNTISLIRLLVGLSVVVLVYFFLRRQESAFIWIALIMSVLFVFLVRWFSILSFERRIVKAKMDINQDELNYLEKNELNFANGKEFIDTGHAYSYDLDFFGDHSLYQVLNRTQTFIGKKTLASNLLHRKPQAQILKNQKAVKELTNDLEWRQEIQSLGRVTDDSREVYENLKRWTQTDNSDVSKLLIIASYVMPALLIGLMIFNYTFNAGWGFYLLLLFLVNLGIVGREVKNIKKELTGSTKIDRTLKSYSNILQKIEEKRFESEALIDLQNRLKVRHTPASQKIKKLSQLFDQLENILNPFGAVVFNGFLLYHLHTLRGFRKWKAENAEDILDWMEVLGEIESINSFANLSFNNPDFIFPEINSNYQITFKEIGHPLLSSKKRVSSDVDFDKQNFIILTGSNMSGKSTFLRSLGVNMVLASAGSPVCAAQANIHPMPVLVSMRVSDSLNDNESFFFAEVKRLKEVMDAAESEVSFVLLDEILRGTNSDDKRTGTVEVIKKIISKKAIGAVATHDLKVCDTVAEFPNQLVNKCFEVEIRDDELHFDYKLREGICQNKSATFLMKKMDVI